MRHICLISFFTLTFFYTMLSQSAGLLTEQGELAGLNPLSGFIVAKGIQGSIGLDEFGIQSRNVSGLASTYFINRFGGNIDLLGFGNSSGDLLIDGAGIYYNNQLNRTGFGTSSPTAKLHINAAGEMNGLKIDDHQNEGILINGGGIGVAATNQSSFGFISFQAGSNGFVSSQSGNNGFFANTPSNHGIQVQGAHGSGGHFNNQSSSILPSVFIEHGNDSRPDLALGGNGFIAVDGNMNIQLDADDNAAFHAMVIYSSAAQGGQYIAEFKEGGDVRIREDLAVTGLVSKGGGTFKIDHPLDPQNKYLFHSFVESPDMMNVYNGNVMLDAEGAAEIVLPDYFEALNQTFRYQLTCIGSPALVYIAEKIKDNSFKIAGGNPNMEVSWQVTGVRQDPYANQNRVKVEVEKEPQNKGRFLHPEAYSIDRKLADQLLPILPTYATDH